MSTASEFPTGIQQWFTSFAEDPVQATARSLGGAIYFGPLNPIDPEWLLLEWMQGGLISPVILDESLRTIVGSKDLTTFKSDALTIPAGRQFWVRVIRLAVIGKLSKTREALAGRREALERTFADSELLRRELARLNSFS